MSYQSRLSAHLAAYKFAALGVLQPGVFKYDGKDLPRDHILPIEHADLNLLPIARELEPQFLATHRHVTRHRYFHHLNSSQAFAFNLFLPFFSRRESGADVLLRALGQTSQPISDWDLEVVPDEDEGTNLDARWVTQDGVTTICEVKLSEAEFGKADDDGGRHTRKLANTYRPFLVGHVDDALLQAPTFFRVYQVLRNVWHLLRLDRGRLLFLLPRANTHLHEMLAQVLEGLTAETRARISIVFIEDVLTQLRADAACPEDLRQHADEMIAKYLPSSN